MLLQLLFMIHTWQGQRELLMCLGLVLLLYSLRPYRSSTTQSKRLLR